MYYYRFRTVINAPEGSDVHMRERGGSVVFRTALFLVLGVLQLICVGCAWDTAKYPELSAQDGVVTIDLSDIGAQSGRFHTYRSSSGKKVDFFVYRESSGVPHAVLDACRTCYRWKKGYVLEGREVVCLKCDMRFKLDSLAQGTGSCVPLAIKTEQRGATLIVPVTELEAGARYF